MSHNFLTSVKVKIQGFFFWLRPSLVTQRSDWPCRVGLIPPLLSTPWPSKSASI